MTGRGDALDTQPTDFAIREMRPGEEAALVALALSVWAPASMAKNITDAWGPINGHPWTDHKADQLLGDIDSADSVLVAESPDGAAASFVTLRFDRKYATGTIGHLAVAADLQGKGLGRRMIRESLARFRREGLKYARIDALVQNERAWGLYQSEGFVEVAKTTHLFQPL